MAVPGVRTGMDRSPGCCPHEIRTWKVIYPREMTEKGEPELEGSTEIKNGFVLQKNGN